MLLVDILQLSSNNSVPLQLFRGLVGTGGGCDLALGESSGLLSLHLASNPNGFREAIYVAGCFLIGDLATLHKHEPQPPD